MDNTPQKRLTLTVGIPTYDGGPSLIKSVEKVLASQGVPPFRVVVCVDGKPLEPKIEARLRELGVDVLCSRVRGGQRARIKQMIAVTSTDIIILTQDDILFTPFLIRTILETFARESDLTLISGNGQPLPPQNFFESVVHVGMAIAEEAAWHWKDGDNYMHCGGKCLAFRTDFLKKMTLAEEILNSDTNFYFLNRAMGGKFRYLRHAVYYLRSPQTLQEHSRQSGKSQRIPEEIQTYLNIDINKEFSYPMGRIVRAAIKSFLTKPLRTLCYIGVWLYTHTVGRRIFSQARRFWASDPSTKKI